MHNKPSLAARSYSGGLTLAQVACLANINYQTLFKWHKTRPELFILVCYAAGSLALTYSSQGVPAQPDTSPGGYLAKFHHWLTTSKDIRQRYHDHVADLDLVKAAIAELEKVVRR